MSVEAEPGTLCLWLLCMITFTSVPGWLGARVLQYVDRMSTTWVITMVASSGVCTLVTGQVSYSLSAMTGRRWAAGLPLASLVLCGGPT